MSLQAVVDKLKEQFGDTEDWIFNLLFGVMLPVNQFLTPFGEVRYEVGSDRTNQLVFSIGALLGTRTQGRAGGRR